MRSMSRDFRSLLIWKSQLHLLLDELLWLGFFFNHYNNYTEKVDGTDKYIEITLTLHNESILFNE